MMLGIGGYDFRLHVRSGLRASIVGIGRYKRSAI